MSIIQVHILSRKERYNHDQDYRSKILKQIQERRQRNKNNGFTDKELAHINKFLAKHDSTFNSMIHRYSHNIKHSYIGINKHGIPTVGFNQ